ncbi:hypothetical protein [Haloplanus natans]|uniref:hypothetical protein n=1 Tax=Haloplanus natans TaxID=376171 RepID=UPI00146FAFCD|nr:hypothetical protein [Haloplanus natans]
MSRRDRTGRTGDATELMRVRGGGRGCVVASRSVSAAVSAAGAAPAGGGGAN